MKKLVFSQFWRLSVQKHGWQVWFPECASPWLVGGRLLPRPYSLSSACPWHLSVSTFLFLQYHQLNWIRVPPQWAHFNLITSKDPVSKYSHILKERNLGLKHMNLGEVLIQLITLQKNLF